MAPVPLEVSTSAPVSLDLTTLVQYGILGIILILVLLGYLWPKPSVDRIVADKRKAEEQRDALLDAYQTKVIPVLTEVQNHVIPGVAMIASGQSEIKSAIEEVRRSVEGVRDEVRRKPR